jgi:Bifunctional DNA primase/polymerase, N-terminal
MTRRDDVRALRRRVLTKITALTSAAMEDLHADLLDGRLDVIDPGGLAWIEDMLSGRVCIPSGATNFVFACWWAQHGWPVFPQSPTKAPIFPSPHPRGTVERRDCKGRCGRDGHGVYDATTDIERIRRWARERGPYWGGLAAAIPAGLMSLDVDNRHDGHIFLARLQEEHEPLPETQETLSGRGDGGRHLFYRAPAGVKLSGHALIGTGVDLKAPNSAVRLPPSRHQDNPVCPLYRLVSRPIAVAPDWLIEYLQPPPVLVRLAAPRAAGKGSVADEYGEAMTWTELLTEQDWTCLDGEDGDGEGARWRHPDATLVSSASLRNDRLYVYSTNTDFEPTSYGDPKGYSKFHAYAVFNHDGDMKRAAKELRTTENEWK